MIIRQATIKDLENVKEIRKEFFIDELKYNSALNANWVNRGLGIDTYKILSGKHSICYIAVEKNKIIGYAAGGIEKLPAFYKFRKRGHLFSIFIKKNYRGRGIGKKLMQKVNGWFSKNNIEYKVLFVFPRNRNSHKIYKHVGYEDVAIIMRKK